MLISKRMGLSPSHLSDIQRGKKRPGVGGAKKGRIPWNKGITGYKLNCDRKGKLCCRPRMVLDDVLRIRQYHTSRYVHADFEEYITTPKRGGVIMSYEWFLAKHLATTEFRTFTAQNIYRIITRKSWTHV